VTLVLVEDLTRNIAFVWHSLSPSDAVANMSPRQMPFPFLYHGLARWTQTRRDSMVMLKASRKLTRLIRNSTPLRSAKK